MKRLAIAFALLASSTASAFPLDTPDNAIRNATRTIQWIIVPDANAYCRTLEGTHAKRQVWRIDGCAKFDLATKTCTIITGPLWVGDASNMRYSALVTIGHEIMHCFMGQWHS